MFDLITKGGFLMYPIILCSVAGCAIFFCKLLQYLSALKHIEAPLAELQKTKPALLEPILASAANGCSDKELTVIATRQVRMVETGLSWMALITTVVPLLGLTGTVLGMIKAFAVIEKSQNVSPAVLAGGIWVALITTVAGLMVAIMVHIGHHYLERKADEIAFVIQEIITALDSGDKNAN